RRAEPVHPVRPRPGRAHAGGGSAAGGHHHPHVGRGPSARDRDHAPGGSLQRLHPCTVPAGGSGGRGHRRADRLGHALGGPALHRQRLARPDAGRTADHRRSRRPGLGRPDPDRSRGGPVHLLVRGLPQPIPEGVSMSLRSLRRPLSELTVALLVLVPLLAGPTPSAFAEGSKEDKIAEREEVDQELEDLRLELGGVNDELADTYLALAETELEMPKTHDSIDEAREDLAQAREEDRLTGERLEAAEEEEERLSGEV